LRSERRQQARGSRYRPPARGLERPALGGRSDPWPWREARADQLRVRQQWELGRPQRQPEHPRQSNSLQRPTTPAPSTRMDALTNPARCSLPELPSWPPGQTRTTPYSPTTHCGPAAAPAVAGSSAHRPRWLSQLLLRRRWDQQELPDVELIGVLQFVDLDDLADRDAIHVRDILEGIT